MTSIGRWCRLFGSGAYCGISLAGRKPISTCGFRITAPSWAPVFSRLGAAVSDVGGIMAHTAIVCREYGLPAVVGTGFATTTIKTGQLIEVDGSNGVVRVLEDVNS